MDHLLDGPLRQHQGLGNPRVVLSLGHLAQHIALPRSQFVQRRVLRSRVLRDERLHDLRIHDRAAGRDGMDGRSKLLDILHPFFQEIRAALAAALQKREHDVLREMAEGKNNAAIAATLFLTERSVEKVIHSIFLKLGLTWEPAVHKRVKAVVLYLAESP